MKKIVCLILVLVSLCCLLTGCSKGITGDYFDDKHSETLIIEQNGEEITFDFYARGFTRVEGEGVGELVVEGDKEYLLLTLSKEGEIAYEWKLEVLTDSDGVCYTLKGEMTKSPSSQAFPEREYVLTGYYTS